MERLREEGTFCMEGVEGGRYNFVRRGLREEGTFYMEVVEGGRYVFIWRGGARKVRCCM